MCVSERRERGRVECVYMCGCGCDCVCVGVTVWVRKGVCGWAALIAAVKYVCGGERGGEGVFMGVTVGVWM